MATITIDGRGDTIRDAIQDMWSRVQGLQARGFQPISQAEIIDTSSKKTIQSYQLTDPDFQLHLKSDEREKAPAPEHHEEHHPPTPHEYPYMARIRLEG